MKRYVVLDKKVGETPLAAIAAWKAANPAYAGVSASYAGRLDPMASGKLLILLGEECKKQKKYLGLDKEYEIEVLLDVGSDTGDALGLIEYAKKDTRSNSALLKKILAAEIGRHERAYPAFSSKTVNGKPLFLHTLEGTLSSIEIPTHEEHVYRVELIGVTRIEQGELKERVEGFLQKVPITDEPSKLLGADFRIAAVRESWRKALAEAGERTFSIITLRVACGSGTYMRSLSGRIGGALETKSLALSIRRTKIGKRWCGLWLKQH